MSRHEFGAKRTTCACPTCVNLCKFIPGFLIPADLDRLIPTHQNPIDWAMVHLAASPGAVLLDRRTGQTIRIPTLVPRTRPESTVCHWLDGQDRCQVHANAPFGCALFSGCDTTNPGRDQSLVIQALAIVAMTFTTTPPGLYARIWIALRAGGFASANPETKRAALAAAEKLL